MQDACSVVETYHSDLIVCDLTSFKYIIHEALFAMTYFRHVSQNNWNQSMKADFPVLIGRRGR